LLLKHGAKPSPLSVQRADKLVEEVADPQYRERMGTKSANGRGGGGEVSDSLESNTPWGETRVPTAEKKRSR